MQCCFPFSVDKIEASLYPSSHPWFFSFSISFSHLAHTVFNLSANPAGWYFQSVSKFTHFSSSPQPPSWLCYAHPPVNHSSLLPGAHSHPSLSPTHRDYVPPSIQEPLVTPISLRIKSKPLPCFTEPFEGWPSGSSNLISLITPLSSTNGLATVPWINPFLSIAVRALSCKQQNPHWLEQEGHSVKDFGKLVDYQRE